MNLVENNAGSFQWLDFKGHKEPSQLSPLVLAYVGDSVYEIYVRSKLAKNLAGNVHKLHIAATSYSRASSQADVVHSIIDRLTEQERAVLKRGRNANSGYVPKNADVTDYRYATGFESLLGFLFLSCNYCRLSEVLDMAWHRVGERNEAE